MFRVIDMSFDKLDAYDMIETLQHRINVIRYFSICLLF